MSTPARSFSSIDEPLLGAGYRIPGWIWLAAPYLLILVVFVALPLGNLVVLSFFKRSTTTIFSDQPTLTNYLQLADRFYVDLLWRSVRVAAVTTAVSVVLGYPLAYFLARSARRIFTLGLFLLVMPLMVSTVIRAFGWIVILGREGALNMLLAAVGLPRMNLLYSETAVVLALVQFVLPLMVLPVMAAIEKIPVAVEEAAVNLGAAPWSVFLRLIVPMSAPGLMSGALLSFTVAVSVVVTPALLGGRKVRMFGNEIYDQVITALNWPFAASLSVVLIVLAFAAIAFALAATARLGRARREA